MAFNELAVSEAEYSIFRKTVLALTGLDLDFYRSQQLKRRLRALVSRTRVASLSQYAALLEDDPSRLREFADLLTINVSEFFRNPERFSHLESAILPLLPRPIRVWSAGCANGSEAYSLAILLDEAAPGEYSLLATDLDYVSLERASKAVYTLPEIATVTPERLVKSFEISSQTATVRSHLRERIRFRRHDLLSDPYPTGFDLIVCRNVIIYFTDEAKKRVMRGFAGSLKPGGYLFLGSTETILSPQDSGFSSSAPFFYRRGNKAHAASPLTRVMGDGHR